MQSRTDTDTSADNEQTSGRRVPGAALKPGALLDGPYLLDVDLGQEIDNMEGISVHQERGRTIVTLVSDDNFSFLQRTILLEFELG